MKTLPIIEYHSEGFITMTARHKDPQRHKIIVHSDATDVKEYMDMVLLADITISPEDVDLIVEELLSAKESHLDFQEFRKKYSNRLIETIEK